MDYEVTGNIAKANLAFGRLNKFVRSSMWILVDNATICNIQMVCTDTNGFLQDKTLHTNDSQVQSVSTGQKAPLTTHILDTTVGTPAAYVQVGLYELQGSGQEQALETSTTDKDGRAGFLSGGTLKNGTIYKLHFSIDSYFARMNRSTFYPYIQIVFQVQNPEQHYHVPLLLSNYGYTTYRGS